MISVVKTFISNQQRPMKALAAIITAAGFDASSALHAQTAPSAELAPGHVDPPAQPSTAAPPPVQPPGGLTPHINGYGTSALLTPTILSPSPETDLSVPTVEQAIIDEETNANPSAALEKYRAIVAAFDSRRVEAARAIFRLGECLRRLGRMEEAKVQYGRILREFVDQPVLVKQSAKLLVDSGERVTREYAMSLMMAPTLSSNPGPLKKVPPQAESSGRSETDTKRGKAQLAASAFAVREQAQLAELEQRIAMAEEELGRTRSLLQLIDKGEPAALPNGIITDPRFAELKAKLQEAVIAPTESDEKLEVNRQQRVESALEMIRKWIKSIYQPELKLSAEFQVQQAEILEQRAQRLRKQIDERGARADAERARTELQDAGTLNGRSEQLEGPSPGR